MAKPWFLLADIGGSNARFAVGEPHSGLIFAQQTYSVLEHPTFKSALQSYLNHVAQSAQWEALPAGACLAVACPVDTEVLTFTNSDWVIDRQDLAHGLGLATLQLINDFAAIGYASAHFCEDDWVQLGDGAARAGAPIAVLGPGTGLGVCAVTLFSGETQVIAGEGGHADFAPIGDEEIEILRLLFGRYGRVSAERLLSGTGLQNIYWALTQMRGSPSRQATPADISTAALAGEDPVAVETLAVFCRVLGSVAGNLALTFGAHGGVYIGGGIAPRVSSFLQHSDFRERFLAKGRFRDYLNNIPTRLITRDNPGLYGALRYLQESQ